MTTRRSVLAAAASVLWAGVLTGVHGTGRALAGGAGRIPAHRRSMFIDRAGLRVRNLEGTILFYRQVIGLEVLSRTEHGALLGAGGAGFLELERDPGAAPAPVGAAGLYHLAFEMPTRPDLARWIVHAARHRIPVSGLADHRVTESVYLDDPEGNGIEVYASRPEAEWMWTGGQVAMGVFDLDLDPLLKLVDRSEEAYAGAPAAMRIGHIHLRVGDLAAAERFYSDLLGFDVTRRASGVVFLSSGKYHHHVAVNVWESAGAGRRGETDLGLSWFSVAIADRPALDDRKARLRSAGVPFRSIAGGIDVEDPWGNRVRLRAI
ncbi:VOC family protein [Rhodobium gokarnense]|uniref:Catechol 2,3-dioxygenase n=1 Tax=Rhodobium gokarnense TaxID=364296 RepID=A0ABT3HB01_9HYPH|nr:VOC family protein [Rhodobium gokarnense]MCW2307471.1 catechol 2,3-dioxygenase [Rhodobium gokarnense]